MAALFYDDTNEKTWGRVLESLKESQPETIINTWLDDTTLIARDERKVVLRTSSDYKRDAIMKRFQNHIARALYQLFEIDYTIEIVTQDEVKTAKPSANPTIDYTFERFVVGPNNEMANAAALAIAEKRTNAYNPLFIYGGSGLGKTHLLYAIKNRIAQNYPDDKTLIFSSEHFTRDLLSAIERGKRQEFQEKYLRSADLLLVDDIQFAAAKDFVQEEFFHIFNTMYENGKQIVIASDKHPSELKKLQERLRSRFEWGLVVDVQPPNLETRIAIVRAKGQMMGQSIPDAVSQFIAESVTTNVRQLEGIVKKLIAYSELMNFTVNIDTAKRAITDLINENPGMRPTAEMILQQVCTYYDVNPEDVFGPLRRANIVQVRQLSMFLIREITGKSFAEIGTIFNRDHTTVMHSVTQIEKNDEKYRDAIETIKNNITNN